MGTKFYIFAGSVRLLLILLLFCLPVNAQDDESRKVFNDSEVAVIEITVDPDDLAWMYEPVNFESDSIHPASVRFRNSLIDETIDSVGFRIRGNTSRYSMKKSFKLSFNSFESGGNFYGLEKMNLNGEHNDPSIARSKICWDLFGLLGMKTSRASHAAVYINGEYYGLYVNVEHIDEEFVQKNYSDDSGDLWKCLFKADLTYQGENPSVYFNPGIAGFHYELKTNEDNSDGSSLMRLIRILNTTDSHEFEDSIETILNIKDVLKYLAFNIYVGSWDDYRFLGNNYYLYHEPSEDLIHLIPYDYDNTFGIDWFDTDWATVDPYLYPVFDNGRRPLSDRLLTINKYRNLFTCFLEFINDSFYNLPLWTSDLNALRTKLLSYAEQDVYRTYDYGFTIEDFSNSFGAQTYRNRHVKRGIKEFFNERHYSLYNQLEYIDAEPFIYDMDWEPKNPGPNDSIYVHAYAFGYPPITEMNIEFHPGNLTDIKNFEMELDPGENIWIPENRNRWTGVIPPLGPNFEAGFTVTAKNSYSDQVYYRGSKLIELRTGDPVTNELLISEFMARNESTLSDDNGEFDDWLEIYNPGNTAVNIKNKFLTDSRNNLTRWKFEGDMSIEPGRWILIWCDGDTLQGKLHANFKLDGDGEFIAIVDSDGSTIIDSVSFGNQKLDVSWGRDADDNNLWGYMNPTPGNNNSTIVGLNIVSNNLPAEFNLSAYPNPFNPVTTIRYELPEPGNVRIKIYNSLGEQVCVKNAGFRYPGVYETKWNGVGINNDKLSTGIYIVRVNAGKNIKTTKLMLMK